MIKVMIVEDEMLVRMGLKSCLQADGDLRVEATFSTAEEAEKYLQTEPIDVLITDVRLPEMDGLELIRRAKQNRPEIIVIVISCYEDFNYARMALQYGAARYVLKHELKEQELPGMIKGLVGSPANTVKEKRQEYPLQNALQSMCEGGAQVLWFAFRGAEESTCATAQEINLGMLTGIIDSYLQKYHLGQCFLWENGTLLALCRKKSAHLHALEICFDEISENLKLYLNKNCFCGASDVFYNAQEFPRRLEEARDRARFSFFFESGMLFTQQFGREALCPALLFEKNDAFSSTWKEENAQKVDSFFRACSQMRPRTEKIKDAVMRYLYAMLEYGKLYFNLDPTKAYRADMAPSYPVVNQFDSMKALWRWLVEIVEQTVHYVQNQDNVTSQIRAYLAEHYTESDLQQGEVAKHFYMSSSHFSQYFKDNFGVNYSLYLNMLRIEQAKLLLRTTKDSTEKIACQVGIPNVNYFFRLFKKREGCTVKMYKSLQEKGVQVES